VTIVLAVAIFARLNANADLLQQDSNSGTRAEWRPVPVHDGEAISSRASAGRVVTRVVRHAAKTLEADLR
jgi:hypothetical protein